MNARSTPDVTWTSLGQDERNAIRRDLVRDQGALCAYCQRRMVDSDTAMRIDHWLPRSGGGAHLAWRNLVGSCLGDVDAETAQPPGTTRRRERLHCDPAKADSLLFLNPVAPYPADPRPLLRFTGAGVVQSDDARAQADVDNTLNLNAPHIVRGRKAYSIRC